MFGVLAWLARVLLILFVVRVPLVSRDAAGARMVGKVVGADLVELAPMPGLHACDFLAAQLAYKMMSYALSSIRRRA